MRKAARLLAIAMVGITGVIGLINAFDELGTGSTALQRSVTYAVALYGAFGVLAAFAMLRRRAWGVPAAFAWSACVVYAATVASFAFSDPGFADGGTMVGVASSGIGSVLMGWLAVRGARESARGAAPAAPAEASREVAP
jgi:hypothetical protein